MTDRSLMSFMEGWAGANVAAHRILKRFMRRLSDGNIAITQPMFMADRSARDALRELFQLTELNPHSRERLGEVATEFVSDALQAFLAKHSYQDLRYPEGIADYERFFREYLRTHGGF